MEEANKKESGGGGKLYFSICRANGCSSGPEAAAEVKGGGEERGRRRNPKEPLDGFDYACSGTEASAGM